MEVATQTQAVFLDPARSSRLRLPKKVNWNVGIQVDLGGENYRKHIKEHVGIQTDRGIPSEIGVQVNLAKESVSDAGTQIVLENEKDSEYLKELEIQKNVNLAIAELCYHLSQKNGIQIENESDENEEEERKEKEK